MDSWVTSPRNCWSGSSTGSQELLNSYIRDNRMRRCSSWLAVTRNGVTNGAQVPSWRRRSLRRT